MQPSDPTLPADLRDILQSILDAAQWPAGTSYADYERSCFAALMAAGRSFAKRAMENVSPKVGFVEDGVHWKLAVRSCVMAITLFGPVHVDRWLFRSRRNGPTRCLVVERAQLVCGLWTEPAAKVAALAISEMPFERAESFFAEQGTVLASRSSLLRLVGGLCDAWEPTRQQNEQAVREESTIPDDACTVAVSLDGVMVMMVDSEKQGIKAAARERGAADKGPAGFREASVGVISFYDAAGKRLATRRYARMPEEDKATTKAWLRDELAQIRQRRPDLTVLAIADGSANNWPFLESLKPHYQLVDFFHTAEHLHRHVSKAHGAATLETQAKLRDMRHALLTQVGAAATVFADMQKLREAAGTEPVSTKKSSGKRQPTFFERHRDRMNFAELRAKNMPIGTGVTESTCKLAVCDRLRRTGMRWTERGGQGVLTLRALLVSDQFDAGWRQLLRTAEVQRFAA